jgi:molecular chaperone DnaK
LTKAAHKIGEAMYKAQAAAGASGAGGAAGGAGGPGAAPGDGNPPAGHGQGDVVDAEFVDVDESKKPN